MIKTHKARLSRWVASIEQHLSQCHRESISASFWPKPGCLTAMAARLSQSFSPAKWLRRLTTWRCGTNLNFTGQCPGRHSDQISHDLANVLGLNLPVVFLAGFVVAETGSHRAGHNRCHLDAIPAQNQHDGLGETY